MLGWYLAVTQTKGHFLSPSSPILHIIESGVLEVRVGIPANDANQLEKNTQSSYVKVGKRKRPNELRVVKRYPKDFPLLTKPICQLSPGLNRCGFQPILL